MGATSLLTYALPIVAIMALFFFMSRSEKKKQKVVEEMRNALTPGDVIYTIGGVIGKIVTIKGDTIVIETSEDRVRMEVTKWAVSNKYEANTAQTGK